MSKKKSAAALSQLADRIRQSAGTKKTDRKPKPKKEKTPREKRNVRRKVLFWVGTVCLVGVLTLAIFVGIFMFYINTSIKNHVEVDMSEYDLSVSTELYRREGGDNDWVMYQTLYAGENRRLVEEDEIADYLRKAAIAIEDKRFETHHGVDWHGTLRAIVSTMTGHSTQGGSTITQQLIKNVTGDNETTVKRKVTEIYRALELETRYDKDDILTFYLNAIYLGNSCYGVETASDMYFDKHAADLTLAESATLIAITNNPSRYDPLRSDWTREQNRGREMDVLNAMLNQGKIEQEEFDAAVNEEVVFTNGYTNMGNYVGEPKPESGGEEEEVKKANNSYFTDQVIEDAAKLLVEIKGLTGDPEGTENGLTAMQKGANLVYGGGYKIYTTENPTYQAVAEDIFDDTDYMGLTDSYGQPLQAAITLMDPYTGEVLAIVGGTGVKEVDRGWNWATSVRQCGSAIKPISTYAPALDNGTITAASALDDYPILLNGRPYPKNSHGGFQGMTTVRSAITESLNTCAVRVNMSYGTTKSYNFMTEQLGFTTLTETDSMQVGNMALGGLEQGVTTEEMAAAYSAFVNDGIYTQPHTIFKIEDSTGQVVWDSTDQIESHVAMKETTAYLMRDMLGGVITEGTGGGAYFSGMSMGGKTGTTDEQRDRYFVGFTPYYCAAVWCGYKSNEVIHASGNPSANLWKQVMQRIHEGLDNPGFHNCSGLTTVSVCRDSGLLATNACSHDVRGSRVRTVTVAADTAPTSYCNAHTTISYCQAGKHVATEYCPEDQVIQVSVLKLSRDVISGVSAADMQYTLSAISSGDLCPVHKEPVTLPEIIDDLLNGGNKPEGGEGGEGEGETPPPDDTTPEGDGG